MMELLQRNAQELRAAGCQVQPDRSASPAFDVAIERLHFLGRGAGEDDQASQGLQTGDAAIRGEYRAAVLRKTVNQPGVPFHEVQQDAHPGMLGPSVVEAKAGSHETP